MKFYYWKAKKDRKWYWHLRASNGEIVAQGEGYSRKIDLIQTLKLIKVEAGKASILHKPATK